jgi:hypothetical protein
VATSRQRSVTLSSIAFPMLWPELELGVENLLHSFARCHTNSAREAGALPNSAAMTRRRPETLKLEYNITNARGEWTQANEARISSDKISSKKNAVGEQRTNPPCELYGPSDSG